MSSALLPPLLLDATGDAGALEDRIGPMAWLAVTARQQHLCLTMSTRLDMDHDEIATALGLAVEVVTQLVDSALLDLMQPGSRPLPDVEPARPAPPPLHAVTTRR